MACRVSLVNEQINETHLLSLWQDLATPSRLILACVIHNQLLTLVQTVVRQLWPHIDVKLVHAQAQAFGVINAYAEPEKLGVDRWLALLAVRHHHAIPACVVDCGTAITIDFIDETGLHQGGLISPGLNLMKTALAKGTEQLFLSDKPFSFGLAKQTDAAIYSGTLASALGLIHYAHSFQPNSHLILTGGDAELIAEQLTIPAILDPDLVLRGLAIVAKG